MKRKLPLILSILCSVTLLFSQEKVETTSWYTSADTKGYISIQKMNTTDDASNSVTIKTTVNSLFGNEVLDFSLSTVCDTDKLVSPSKLNFNGTIDSNMKSVIFVGNRLKKSKNASYWNFKGDFSDEATTDPELKPYFPESHNATLRIPNRTIPTFNLWAIIPNLPFDKKGTFKFNTLDETKLYVKKNQTVNYLGTTKAEINGENMILHKFVHQSNGKQPNYYWVNNDRELVQVLLDEQYTFTINSKEAALQVAVVNNND
jgi:hypothetical protein